MLPGRDNIPLLVRRAGAVNQRHGDQVLPEVAGRRVDREALPVGRTDFDPREGSGGGRVPLVGFCGGRGLKVSACSGDGDGSGGVGGGNPAGAAGDCCCCCSRDGAGAGLGGGGLGWLCLGFGVAGGGGSGGGGGGARGVNGCCGAGTRLALPVSDPGGFSLGIGVGGDSSGGDGGNA